MNSKPFSQACENNKTYILDAITPFLKKRKTVLEISSGTGQHGVYFASNLPHVNWQTSDLPDRLEGINTWRNEANLSNLPQAIQLDVNHLPWPINHKVDMVFTANAFHIYHWSTVCQFFKGVKSVLKDKGVLCVYGPFKENNQFDTQSNEDFDRFLKIQDPQMGLRNIEELDLLAKKAGLQRYQIISLPANNRIIIWRP